MAIKDRKIAELENRIDSVVQTRQEINQKDELIARVNEVRK